MLRSTAAAIFPDEVAGARDIEQPGKDSTTMGGVCSKPEMTCTACGSKQMD